MSTFQQLPRLGLGMMHQLGVALKERLGLPKRGRMSPMVREREQFESDVKDQFVKLKEKGLGISIFTL